MKLIKKFPKHYFTLIELLVVVTIIAILISLLMPAMRKVMFTAKTTACSKVLQNIGVMVLTYADDYNDIYPNDGLLRGSPQQWFDQGSHTNTAVLLAPYVSGGKEGVTCPAQRRDLTEQTPWNSTNKTTRPIAFNNLPIYDLYFSSTGSGSFGPAVGPYKTTRCTGTDIRSECMGYHRSRWSHRSLPANYRDIYMARVGDNFKVEDSNYIIDDGSKALKGHKSNVMAADYTVLQSGFGHNYIRSNHIWGAYEYDNWTWDRNGAARWGDPRYQHWTNTTITEIDEGGEVYSNYLFDDASVRTYNNIFYELWKNQMTRIRTQALLPNDSAFD